MKITSAPPSTPTMRHAAGFHSGGADLLDQLVPLAEAALTRAEPVACALHPDTTDALADALGDPAALHRLSRPGDDASGQTLAVARARELRELGGGGPVTVLTEHLPELDGADGAFWTELDAAVNVALSDLPVDVTCFYPDMPLHLAVLDGARRNHPHLLVHGELQHNPDHRSPREVLADRPVAPPLLLGVPDLRLPFQAWQLQDVRAAVRSLADGVGFTADRIDDVVLAVNEVATNAVEHGGSEADLHVWATDRGLVCEVHDGGRLADPLPGMRTPHASDPRGRGLWIARQLCDLLHVWSDAGGTHVRVRAAR